MDVKESYVQGWAMPYHILKMRLSQKMTFMGAGFKSEPRFLIPEATGGHHHIGGYLESFDNKAAMSVSQRKSALLCSL